MTHHSHPSEVHQHLEVVLRAGKVFGQQSPNELEDMADCLPMERVQGGQMHYNQVRVVESVEEIGLLVDRQSWRLTMWGKLRSWLQRQPSEVPSIADMLYRAGHIAGIAQRDRSKAAADLYLQPPVKHFALMDYKRAAEIAEVGYHHTPQLLSHWGRRF